ncbi:hypothetical protein C8Q80DRAFT_688859 [Daedaleopsis nitida]|nr:hypothetical protein C8Q80DRAFT_688859 [Daedaleopsis nitida]
MALNDTDQTLGGNRGVDLHPGVANPTISSTHADPLKANFVTDPTDETLGAGAGPHFTGPRDAARNFSQTAGVVEGRPGIIESTNIDPLNENSNKDDGWANAQSGTGAGVTDRAGGLAQGAYNTATSVASGAATMASSAAQTAYGYVAGDPKSRQAGKESSA